MRARGRTVYFATPSSEELSHPVEDDQGPKNISISAIPNSVISYEISASRYVWYNQRMTGRHVRGSGPLCMLTWS